MTTTIEVRFFEEGAEDPFAVSQVPLTQLPDTFELDTTLHLGEQDWRVVSAQPPRKSAFKERGVLELVLSRVHVTHIDPSTILYSLPTIHDALPEVEPTESLDGFFLVEEDDWRQFEFIDQEHARTIHEELEDVLEIHQNHRVEMGFEQLHVRQRIETPLSRPGLHLDHLTSHFEFEQRYPGVAFGQQHAMIEGGFAMCTTSGWVLWGVSDSSRVIKVLNLAQTSQADVARISDEVDAFLETHDLYLVDWCSLFWCGPDQYPFAHYEE